MEKNKGKKIVLIVLLMLAMLVIGATGTYALYRSSTTATGTVGIAKWSVKVDGTDIESANYTFTGADITWDKNAGENHKIAPGAQGTIEIPVDATGSEVGVVLTATLGSVTLPDGMTVSVASGDGEKTIAYNATSMATTVTLNIEWAGSLEDTTAKDTTDKAVNNTNITIPITLTARQVLPQ